MRYGKKFYVTAVLAMVLVFMLSVTVFGDTNSENPENSGTAENSDITKSNGAGGDNSGISENNGAGSQNNDILNTLKGALGGTDFSGVGINSVDLNVDFNTPDLNGADLNSASLGGVDLSGVDLSGLNLSGIDISSVDFSGINLAGTDLSGVNPKDADLNGKIDEYLKSLGYKDEDIPKIRAALADAINSRLTSAVNTALTGKDTADTGAVSEEKPQEAEAEEPQVYVVKRGDNLSKIAKNVYGDAGMWTVIYQLNRDQIGNPNEIEIGQVLRIS